MAAAYNPSVEMASLNLDHNWGGPSLGWCERIWLQDSALWVRYTDLDPATVELVRTKRYTRRSAEIALSHPITGGWYFTGCALLGNARPAVAGLPPVTLCRPQYVLTAPKETPVPELDPPRRRRPRTPPSPSPPKPSWPPSKPKSPKAPKPSQPSSGRKPSSTSSAASPSSEPASRPPWPSSPAPSSSSCSPTANPATVKLQADPAKPAVETSIAEHLLQILAAVPAVEALTAGRLADADPATRTISSLPPSARPSWSRNTASAPAGASDDDALTADAHRMHSVHQPQFLPLPVKGGSPHLLNAITCTDAAGFAVPGANTAGLRAQGVAWKPFDNTTGSDGTLGDTFNSFGATRYVEVDSQRRMGISLHRSHPKARR